MIYKYESESKDGFDSTLTSLNDSGNSFDKIADRLETGRILGRLNVQLFTM